MTSRLLKVSLAIAACAALALPAIAIGRGAAETKVTIKVQGTGDFSGTLKSSKTKCANHRKVVLFKQKGQEQKPSTDKRVGMDTSERSGDKFEWNMGNTGLRGKFYARAGKIPGCKTGTSKTVRSPA
jgi:hypothetical protein